MEFKNALDRLVAGEPTDKMLEIKAKRGTLRIGPSSVAVEAGRARTLIGHAKCAYPRIRTLIEMHMEEPTEPPTSFEEINRNLREDNKALQLAVKLAMSRVAAMHRFVKKTERDAERRAKEAQRQIEAMRERSNRVDGANVVALHSDRQSETD
ncbi:hypothetical protein IQ285_32775 [Burkholderia sp. R-69608]|nr:hypothetical protein [Burkholderia sp. R-69608]